MPYKNKNKQKEALHEWYLRNKEKCIKKRKKWDKEHPEKRKEINKKSYLKQRKLYPWKKHYKATKQRCENPNHRAYKYYGGRGIKLLMTMDDFKELWFRDKAYLLESPSIDRIKSDKNYCLKNCRFIELEKNKNRVKLDRNKDGTFKRRIKYEGSMARL